MSILESSTTRSTSLSLLASLLRELLEQVRQEPVVQPAGADLKRIELLNELLGSALPAAWRVSDVRQLSAERPHSPGSLAENQAYYVLIEGLVPEESKAPESFYIWVTRAQDVLSDLAEKGYGGLNSDEDVCIDGSGAVPRPS